MLLFATDTPMSSPRHIALSCLASVLLAAMVIAPVAPEIHQAFADHDHFLCGQHHRIEDAGLKRARVFGLFSAPNSEPAFVSHRAGSPRFEDRPPCVFSNLHVESDRAALVPFELASRLPPAGAPRAREIDIPPSDPLSVAPKHSPPDCLTP
jgi:hypothetical protein